MADSFDRVASRVKSAAAFRKRLTASTLVRSAPSLAALSMTLRFIFLLWIFQRLVSRGPRAVRRAGGLHQFGVAGERAAVFHQRYEIKIVLGIRVTAEGIVEETRDRE